MAKKEAKLKKAPKIFSLQIKRRRFERHILRRVYVNSDREFLLALYVRDAAGRYRRPELLSDEQIQRLRELAKSIKRNRGVVRTGKLVILLILVAAVVVFSLFFKNPLLERVLERGMEGVFGARVEVSGLDFRVLGGDLSFDHLEVADREAPFKNLFELGWTQVALDTVSLLKGRFVLDNVETRDLAWNTDRRTSGALAPEVGTRDEKEEPVEEGPREPAALARAASTALARLDVEALLAQESGALHSPAKVETVNRRLEELRTGWTGRVARSREEIESLYVQIDTLRNTDVGAIRTLPEAQALTVQLRELVPAVRSLQEDVSELNRAFQADLGGVDALRREIEGAIEADVSYLRSRLDLSGGGLKNLASSLASRTLEQLLGRMYRYAVRAKEYGLALAERSRKQRKERPLRRAGRDIAFPTTELPRFLLRRLALSVAAGGSRTEGSIRDLSSDPDLVGRPVVFAFSRDQAPRLVSVEGFLDTRTRRSQDFGLDLRAEHLPFVLAEGLESLNLEAVSGTLHLSTEFTLDRNGRMEGQGRIELPELAARSSDPQDLLGTTIVESVNSLATGQLQFRYSVEADRQVRLELWSNLDDLLARRLTEKLTALSAEYGTRLRAALEQRLEDSLQENQKLHAILEDLEAAAGGNLAQAGAYQQVVAAKQRELEGKLAELRQKATDSLKKEAEEQLEGVTDKLQLPKITF